jgi:hypothetical protein
MKQDPKNWEDQLDQKIQQHYSTSLMNNTKWREVWEIICHLGLRIQFAYADSVEWNGNNSEKLWGPLPLDYVQERGIRDPGIGGPFLYKQILWLRVPKVRLNDAAAFQNEVKKLGKIPISENEKYIEILGYQ